MSIDDVAFEVEQGLAELPGTPARWIWAFTCPTPKCACRMAVVLSMPGDRATLLERGRPVADAWRRHAHYGQVAQELQGVVTFAVDLDTLDLFPAVGDAPLDTEALSEVREVFDRIDDGVLDTIACLWHYGKGEQPAPEPGADGSKIEIEGWRPGDPVVWDVARPALRRDTYALGERIFEAVELYCVKPDCECTEVIVGFDSVIPRGAPHPGHVEIAHRAATLHLRTSDIESGWGSSGRRTVRAIRAAKNASRSEARPCMDSLSGSLLRHHGPRTVATRYAHAARARSPRSAAAKYDDEAPSLPRIQWLRFWRQLPGVAPWRGGARPRRTVHPDDTRGGCIWRVANARQLLLPTGTPRQRQHRARPRAKGGAQAAG